MKPQPRRRPGPGQRQQGQVRGHRQVARFSGLQNAEGPAGLAGQIELRPPRYARSGDRHRDLRARRKPYEFGDMLNLDVSETLFSAIRREGARVPLNLEYSDLQVQPVRVPKLLRHRADARLQPQHDPVRRGPLHPRQKVALALAHLIRTQYPGDSLRCVLFHDSAEELAISQLARVQVGPYYTNTRDGLILAQRLLNAGAQGHAPDRDDHRRQAQLPDARRRPGV